MYGRLLAWYTIYTLSGYLAFYICSHNMVNFGLLTAEIDWRVWVTPSYFNGYRVLAALLHGSQVVGVSQPNFAVLNRVRHL